MQSVTATGTGGGTATGTGTGTGTGTATEAPTTTVAGTGTGTYVWPASKEFFGWNNKHIFSTASYLVKNKTKQSTISNENKERIVDMNVKSIPFAPFVQSFHIHLHIKFKRVDYLFNIS